MKNIPGLGTGLRKYHQPFSSTEPSCRVRAMESSGGDRRFYFISYLF